MKKRFKNKRKKRVKFKALLFIITLFISFIYVCKNLSKKDDIKMLNLLINNTDNDLLNFNSKNFILKYTLGMKEETDTEKLDNEIKGDIIVDVSPKPSINEEPLVYIYNTHQGETYNKDVMEAYNISPTVMLTSYMLKEELINLGVPTIVETNSIKDVLNKNNWIYKDSYKASRILLEKANKDNPSLKMFIDIHRDSSKYQNTTYKDKNKSYAKILFVVGLDYKGYETNLNNAIKLNDIFKKDNHNLARGIYRKTGKGVNGIYNQNFQSNTFLIEVGGQYNNIEEVKNTIRLLAKSIKTYIKENINEKEI